METLIDKLRDVIGVPDFYIENGNYSSTWDYGAMLEYVIAGLLLIVVITFSFKALIRLLDKI